VTHNKRKIINDPVHGFITVPNELLFDIMEHHYFQRLRYIKQLGLTYLVYPGANHTRFQHALGSMHLMTQAVEMLKVKEIDLTNEEIQGLYLAILLHDIGHGPFSHALEHTLVENVSHEMLSLIFFSRLNKIFHGQLDMAIQIFSNTYPKNFLHQLVAGQMDMDRLDYLMRDSFFTGVSEGVIGTDRIIKMLNVFNDELVVDVKGIYSIEKFIVARRLMYWQVYLHKTVISAEQLLINILKRAKYLCERNEKIFTTPAMEIFLKNTYCLNDFESNPDLLDKFAELDDHDVFFLIKMWTKADDKVLSLLSRKLVNRSLLQIEIGDTPFDECYISEIKNKTIKKYGVSDEEAAYFVFTDEIVNNAYNPYFDNINILFKDNKVLDISKSSEQLNIELLSKTIRKHYLCYPKNL
jgi:hypothetical protein